MLFYVGLHNVAQACRFDRVCLSINKLRTRRKAVSLGGVAMVDSGAFTEVSKYGGYRDGVEEYARHLRRLADGIVAIEVAVAQDFMCEPWMIERTGLSVAEHQRLTIERYDALCEADPGVPLLPVIQGFDPTDYRRHLEAYGERLTEGMRVGVGSVCKRNRDAKEILDVLFWLKIDRPDLRLHGFGIKLTALRHDGVRDLLYSSDSMAWSFHARKNGRDANDWREAERFVNDVDSITARETDLWQQPLMPTR